MPPVPLVSIVIPVFNDESTIAATLDSCLAQTLEEIEVICVDDASTDRSAEVVAKYAKRDPRVHLIELDSNRSAFHARRVGVLAARADRLVFVDGDDELAPDAAHKLNSKAQSAKADLIGFGIDVVGRGGRTGGAYERKLQPRHRNLVNETVLRGLFPIDEQAQGQLWRFLFRTSLVREAYELVPDDLVLPRVNDLPLLFLVSALAKSYVSIPDRLYRYHFGRGGSGHRVDSLARAQFYAGAIVSVESIGPAVAATAAKSKWSDLVRDTYESVRLSVIAHVLRQIVGNGEGAVIRESLDHLRTVASERDIVQAAARFDPGTLSALARHTNGPRVGKEVRHILLAVSTLTTGGVSSMLLAQAHYLQQAGYRVTIAARRPGSDLSLIPDSIDFVELPAAELGTHLRQWAEVCRTRAVDVVIDHYVLYAPLWPEYALMAGGEGVATIGWVHSFVARPLFEGTTRLSQLEHCIELLARLVVLSPLDVAYFTMRGVKRVSYAPNPPSDLLLAAGHAPSVKSPPMGRLELVWWGRLTEHTKRISELLNVASALRDLGVDFHLTLIGPDSPDMSAARVTAEAQSRGLRSYVTTTGALRGERLLAAIDAAHVFLSTSIIEGYQLTIAEAQSRGLPVAMYELPWLTLLEGNEGILSTPQGAFADLAQQLADLSDDAERYARLSTASFTAAERAHDLDYPALYRAILNDDVPASYSPRPTPEDARLLLRLMVFYAENAARPTLPVGLRAATRWTAARFARRTLDRFPRMRPLARRIRRWLRR